MRRLFPYIQPFTLLILAIMVLRFIQANADLSLPDYMSRIVNVGIQQGGVEEVLPQAMRRTTLDHLLLFLPRRNRPASRPVNHLLDAMKGQFPQSVAAGISSSCRFRSCYRTEACCVNLMGAGTLSRFPSAPCTTVPTPDGLNRRPGRCPGGKVGCGTQSPHCLP
ncbi:MAG: hypothetical protein N2508_10055 [Anaerolineae bacterium]|nr:hypothetical protein [Anaerolineae bacterium]